MIRLRKLLEKPRESTLILAHRNADFDGVASAIVTRYLLHSNTIHIGIPEGIARPVKDFLTKIGQGHIVDLFRIYESPNDLPCTEYETVIILDTSSVSQLEDFTKLLFSCKEIIVIDHHVTHEGFPERSIIISDPSATATTEIILREYIDTIPKLPEWLVCLCLAAIIVDSRKFSRAGYSTFEVVHKLVNSLRTVKYENIVQALQQREFRFDEKMARIKGMLRLEAYRYGDKIVCLSHVSAHEASLARLLLEAGCDTVIIVSEHDKEFRIIARTKEDNLSMAELCARVASRLGGQGGGHPKAGAAAIKASKESKLGIRRIMRECIKEISNMLNVRLRKVKP